VNLLDALRAATSASGDTVPLTEREVRDNLLAILINGHQTVAICVALTLCLLPKHPSAMRSDVALVERFVPAEEFRRVLENAPAGLFTIDLWQSWHERFGMPVPPLPRRPFPDGSLGPEAGRFFGR
jgi:hypothetical protein